MPKRKTALENATDALSTQEPKTKKKSAGKTSAASKTPAATHKHVAPKTTKSVGVTANVPSTDDLGGQTVRRAPAREHIELRAYFHFLARGGQHGFDVEDWCRAERELMELA